MQQKKNFLSIGLLILGLLLGWVFIVSPILNDSEHQHEEPVQTPQQWTCSMDPQIMQSEPGSCPICGMDLIPAETNGEGLSADQFELTENALALANVQTTIVGESIPDHTGVKISGKIVENETTQSVQVSYFSGRIERLYVQSLGEKIHKGQRLATIYAPEVPQHGSGNETGGNA